MRRGKRGFGPHTANLRLLRPGDLPKLPIPGTDTVAPSHVYAPTPAPQRRRIVSETTGPLVPTWLHHPWDNLRWTAGDWVRKLAFHFLRLPVYACRLIGSSPRGLVRVVRSVYRWMVDWETRNIRRHTLHNLMTEHFLYVEHVRRPRIRARCVAVLAGGIGLLIAGNYVATSTLWTVFAAIGLITSLGLLGRLETASEGPVLLSQPLSRKLTTDRLTRALVTAKLAADDRIPTFRRDITRDGEGWSTTLDLPYGTTAVDAMKKRHEIAAGLDIDETRLFMSRVRGESGSARCLEVWVADNDPYVKNSPVVPFAVGKKQDFWQGIPFGLDARHNPVTLHLIWSNLLIGSIPRMGKTNAARVVTAGAALDPDVKLVIIDGKGGADWEPFAEVADVFHCGVFAEEVTAISETLTDLVSDMNRRYQTLRRLADEDRRANRPSRVPDAKLTPELAKDPALHLQVTLVVVDEVQRYLEDTHHGVLIRNLLTDLAKVGSAVGVILILATQKPDIKVMPDSLRGQLGTRFALRVKTWQTSDTILGAGSYPSYDASAILEQHLGVGWLLGGDDNPQADIGGKLVCTYQCDLPTLGKIIEWAKEYRGQRAVEGAQKNELFAAIVYVFGEDEKLKTETLVERLQEHGSKWRDMARKDLIKMIGEGGVTSKTVALAGGIRARGFSKADFTALRALPSQNACSEPQNM